MKSSNKIIAVTMGCPVGIGPEVIIKSFADYQFAQDNNCVVFGDFDVLQKSSSCLGQNLSIKKWIPGEGLHEHSLNVYHVPDFEDRDIRFDCADFRWGTPDKKTGTAMAAYIEHAFKFINHGEPAGMVTCPITKSALNEAGYNFPGHTEMLAHLCRATEYGMMMAGATLKVTLVTIHQALAEVPKLLSIDNIYNLIELTGRTLRDDFAIENPRIGVAGINPHAGEGGMFGKEEKHSILPAVLLARENGLDASGPFPPDTIFNSARQGQFDAVVCMYHDQGLIPFKLLHFNDGVNVTMGLPIVRTSVDHGTAYDIAGKGVASPDSLKEAIKMAGAIIRNRVNKK